MLDSQSVTVRYRAPKRRKDGNSIVATPRDDHWKFGGELKRRAREEDDSGFEDGVAAIGRTERAVYRMLRVVCSSPHAFRSRRRLANVVRRCGGHRR